MSVAAVIMIWAATWQNQQCGCAPSEDSDQPGHPPSLIRVFAVRMKKACVLSYPLSAQRSLWSDWVDLLILSCRGSYYGPVAQLTRRHIERRRTQQNAAERSVLLSGSRFGPGYTDTPKTGNGNDERVDPAQTVIRMGTYTCINQY